MLTPERRAELRGLLDGTGYDSSEPLRDWMMGHLAGRTHAAMVDGAVNALPALLDAADERDRLLRTVSEMTDNLIDAGYSEAELGAERAALAATVERVRSELSRLADEPQRDGWDSLTMRGVIASIRDVLDGAGGLDMSHFCDDCDHLHTAADTVAIGRFLPTGPQFRANYVNSPLRTTRAAAERDMCRFRQTLHPEPEQGGLFE